MPEIDPPARKKRTKPTQTLRITRPDAGEATRTESVAHAQSKVPLSGDAPQTRAQDTRRAEDYVRRQYEAEANKGVVRTGVNYKPVKYVPHTTVQPQTAQNAAFTKNIQRRHEQQAAHLAPVLSILNQTARPIHAVAGAADAAVTHRNVPHAALQGLENKTSTTFSDVLKHAGVHNKILTGVGGFGLDVLLDPTTYVSLGTASVGRKAAEEAGRKATKDALKAGASKATANRAGRAAAKKTLAIESNKGMTVGALGKRTSGRTTAKIARGLHVQQVAELARGALPGRLLRHVAPGVKPAGVTQAQFDKVRSAMVRGRATAALGERYARNRAQAVARALGGGSEHPQIVDALENSGAPRMSAGERAQKIADLEHVISATRGSASRQQSSGKYAFGKGNAIHMERAARDAEQQLRTLRASGTTDSLAGLSDSERQVVAALQHDYDRMHQTEHAAGLVGPKFKEFGYHPRRPLSDLEPAAKRNRPSGAHLASSKARTNRKPYAAFRGSSDDIYTQNVPLAYYMRARDSAVKLGRKVVIDALHGEGKRFNPGQAIPAGHEIYKFGPREMPSVVEGDELKSLMRGGAPPGLNEYRVLPKALVDVAKQGVPQRLEGLDELGRLWDRTIQGRVKTILTVPNPQYHLTNLYGDLFNAYLGSNVPALAKNLGISAAALTYRARREAAAKTLGKQLDPASHGVKIGGTKLGLDTLIKEAETHGAINQGFIGRDLAEVLDSQGKEAAERLGQGRTARHLPKAAQRVAASRVGSRALHPIDTIRDLSQYREDAVRLATYLGARKRGLSPDDAAKFTNQHHFDYGDLTQFEKSVLRRALPFYTFTARNTPLQVKTLLSKPGKYANVEKLREEALKASSIQPGYEQNIQYYEQQGAPIPIPGTSNLLYPKLPLTDLGRLTVKDQGNYLMAMLTPLIKTPVELNQNYSFFLRKNIDDLVNAKGPHGEHVETLKPAPPALLALINRAPKSIRGEIAKALRLQSYVDQKTQQKVVGWPARIDYAWRATPATSFASSAGSQIPNSRGQSPGQATFGYVTGLKVVPYSPPDVTKNNAGKSYDYLQAVAKKMRHDGTAYNRDGTRTKAYQKVLDQSREAFKVIDPTPPQHSSMLSPEAQKAIEGVRKQMGSGSGMSPEAEAALATLRAGR